MKILMANYPWIGGIAKYIEEAFTELGHEVEQNYYRGQTPFLHRAFKLNQIKYLDRKCLERIRARFNIEIRSHAKNICPDMFFVFNEGYVNTETVQSMRCMGIRTVCLIGDNPFDSYRFRELPYSLKYFDHIYVAEKNWISNIRMVAAGSKIIKMHSAYDSRRFNIDHVKENDQARNKEINCQIAFSGESYYQCAEGGYRCAVLSNLVEYGLVLWGDCGWKYQFKFYPELVRAYNGGRLSLDELVSVYANATINLNMPSPQIITSFQPRVFEIAACGGFQIVDYREDLLEVFKKDEIVTFKTIPELKEKVEYFIRYPEKRKPYIDSGLKAIKGNTWKDRVEMILNNMDNY